VTRGAHLRLVAADDPHVPPADAEIIRAIQGGDRHAFAQLFRASFNQLWHYARAIVRSDETAEEVVDDVFAWLWEHRNEWTPTTTVRAYLFRAVRNRALNAVVAARSIGRIEDNAARQVTPVAMGQGPARQDDQLASAEVDTAVRAAVDALSPDTRAIVTFRWQHGMSWDEIADATGLSPDAARMKHARALKQLKAQLPHLRG